MKMKILVISLIIIKLCAGENLTFPNYFMFGVSSSAYQIEGAWNKDGTYLGKGENIWDRFTHTYPERIVDHSTGDISCDSYHRYKEDVELLTILGVDFYRFSISWSRILPSGHSNQINKAGITYYNNLINELLKNGIKPMATLYHWDLPQPLQDVGGWPNPVLSQYFEDYARVVFEHFGDRVKMWLTFNEPKLICVNGYGDGRMAPGIKASGFGEYLCGHTVLIAHAKVYHLYRNQYRKKQKGEIGIALHSEWFEPETKNMNDVEAAERKLQFDFGWFGNPILHETGDYPSVMKKRLLFRSQQEGFPRSRLPNLTKEEIDLIKGSYDFLGLNMYTASMVTHQTHEVFGNGTNYYQDVGVHVWKDPKWPASSAKRLRVVPWSLRSLLNWIKNNYGNISIIITENGFADEGETDDYRRINYFKQHLNYLLKSIHKDKINVKGFSAWTLMDNFEWFSGFKEHYGLFSVNFKSPNRERYYKKSAYFYRDLIKTRGIVWSPNPEKNNARYSSPIFKIIMVTFIFINLLK